MKKFFKKSLNILMALMTLVNMFIEPICVLASEPVKGDLAYGDQYVRENNGSVNVVDGAFVNEGDVEVRKTVTKLDSNGNYEVKFEVRGKNYSKTTTNTKDIYAVIVFDRSNSMTEGNNKWSNVKNAARAFAEGLIKKYSKANIAVVTFGTTAKTTQEFTNSNLKNISDNKLFGEEPNGGNAGATNLHAGLEKAKTLLSNIDKDIDKDAKDKDAKKYVVVISDGAPTKYEINGSGGNGRTTSYNCIDKAVSSANDLKGSGAEIFTVGYDLSSEIIYKGKDKTDYWGNIVWTDSYKNSTAESILKLIATDASHYVSSDQDNIVDKLKDIASSTTVYSPAGTNLTITDNIGSSFTSSDDTDNDGKIVLNTVKKITEEWQEAGRFNITINENSTTDWHNTNDNFSYSYTDNISSKEINKTCTKNPVVYWVQPEYGYTIEYYYSNVKDESKTVTGNSHEGKTVFVTDEMIEANNKIGYKSVNVIPKSKSIEIKKDTSLNVIKVYYDIDDTQVKDLKYTVRYFKDGVLQEKDTINKTKTVHVLESNYINVDLNEINTTNMYTGYKFDHSKPAVIPASVETGTVIDIYYAKDDSQKVEVKYTVEYYVDGVKQENDTKVVTDRIWVNAEKKLNVKKEEINTTNKYTGYKFDYSDPETIPNVVADGTVIKIYYVKDESKTVNVKYTVEYYKDGVLQENDTKVDAKNIWINATKELEVNPALINTTDKYVGYKFDHSDPETIPSVVADGTVIKIYYVKDESKTVNVKYTVEYYKDGVLQENDTKVDAKNIWINATKELEVNSNYINTTNKYVGYKFDHSEPETIPNVVADGTVIKIYYVKDDSQKVEVKYTVEYYVDGVKQENDTKVDAKNIWINATKELEVNPALINTTDKYVGYKFDHSEPETIPSVVADGTVIKIYYVKDDSQKVEVKYTVEYYVDGVKQENDTKVDAKNIWINATKELEVNPALINTTNKYVGYKFDHSDPKTIPNVVADGTVIKIYYVKDDSQTVEVKYTVEYYKDGMLQENDTRVITDNVWVNDDKVLAVNVDEINTVNKYKGYSFKNTNPEIIPEVINDGGVIKVYYVRNSYPYIIYHVEKGNTENILGIQKGTKKYKDTVKVKECEYTGFTFDSKNKEEIVIDTDNNVAYVYYTRNVYSYNVEHYLEGLDGRFTLKETNEIKNVLYGSEIEYTPNNYAGYTYDSSMTYAPSKVEDGEEVVRLYYRLNSSRVIVHYVVKVDDEYIPFTKAAYDKNGKLIANFEGVELEDAIITGKIGATFTTDLRVVYEYALNGIYEGNILTDANAKKLDGQTITSTIEIEEKEYTYVYEAPRGGDVPPQTGASILGYANYLLLLALIYLVKKYIEVK